MSTPSEVPTNDLRLQGLVVENVKRVKLVTITPRAAAGVVEIAGKNGEGKSSTLDALMYALRGKESIPAKPLRAGTTKGKATVELADKTGKKVLRITRSFTPTDSHIAVERIGGGKVDKPQAFLDALAGAGLGFDPLAFMRQKPKDQVEQLLALVSLEEDPRELDKQRARIFAARTDVNRDITRLKGQLESLPADEESVPDVEISVAMLAAEQARRAAVCREHDVVRAAVAEAVSDHEDAARLVEDLEAQLAALSERLAGARAAATRAGQLVAEAREKVDHLVDPDVDAITQQIAGAETTNAKVREKLKRRVVAEDLVTKQRDAETMTRDIQRLDDRKTGLLAAAKFPVPGLGFELVGNDYAVTFNGQPLEQASQSEQIRVGLAIAMALNPGVHVVLIRDGSLLDADARAIVDTMATEHGFHVLMEVVGDGDAGAFVLEDGGVRDVQPAAKVAW